MKKTLGVLFVVCLAISTSAQQPVVATKTVSSVSASDFRAQVLKELARYKNGAWLYRRCDVFSRKIDYAAARALGLPRSSGASERTLSIDTTVESDISHTADDEEEPTIAINRKNPNIIVAGANDLMWSYDTLYGFDTVSGGIITVSQPAYLSTDAGITWNTYRLPMIDDGGGVPFGDPIIISDDTGTFYYAFLLDNIELDSTTDLMVARSTDGKNWTLGSPVMGNTATEADSFNTDSIQVLEDKETIAVDRDPQSPHYGRLYIAWTEYIFDYAAEFDTEFHYLAFSDDKGDHWSTPVQYSQAYGYFALMRVGVGGTVFIASMGYNDDSLEEDMTGTHVMTISTDGGTTFSEAPIADFFDFPINYYGRNGLKGETGFRATPYPCFDLDSNNKIFAAFGTYDNLDGDAALFETTSTDLGQTWTNPGQIGTPLFLDYDHYMPWVSIDPITHESYISMSSSEEDPNNIESRAIRCSYQAPGQLEFIGSLLFNTLGDTVSGIDFLGDYAGSDAYDGYYAATWTENRPVNNDDGDIFSYVSTQPFGTSGSYFSGVSSPINAQDFEVTSVAPNPVSGNVVTFTISSSDQLPAFIRVFDLRGNEVLTTQSMMDPAMQNAVTLDIHSLSAGVYLTQISCGGQSVQKNFVVLR
jgi:hypothetical protein